MCSGRRQKVCSGRRQFKLSDRGHPEGRNVLIISPLIKSSVRDKKMFSGRRQNMCSGRRQKMLSGRRKFKLSDRGHPESRNVLIISPLIKSSVRGQNKCSGRRQQNAIMRTKVILLYRRYIGHV